MKRGVLLALIGLAAVAAVVGVLGYREGWFSGETPKEPDPPSVRPKPQLSPKEERAKLITTSGLARLKSLKQASPKDLQKAIAMWGKDKGIEREISWQAVRAGLKGTENGQTRIRCCQLATALARKPADAPIPSPADPAAIDPLMTCLKSEDTGLITAAVNALCTMDLTYPALKIKGNVLPDVRRLVASGDPAKASAGLTAVVFLRETAMAPDVIEAWERHAKVSGFTDRSCSKLRILLELKIRADLKKKNPEWKQRKCAEEARKQLPALFERLERDPAKWKAYWAAGK